MKVRCAAYRMIAAALPGKYQRGGCVSVRAAMMAFTTSTGSCMHVCMRGIGWTQSVDGGEGLHVNNDNIVKSVRLIVSDTVCK
jgi:hypothetical protein